MAERMTKSIKHLQQPTTTTMLKDYIITFNSHIVCFVHNMRTSSLDIFALPVMYFKTKEMDFGKLS